MPSKRSNPKILHRAWELRREPTQAERRLWAHLRGLRDVGINFRRQHAIGPYITDFCAPRKKLVIELDGSQHLGEEERDEERTAYLKSRGYKVIRFWNDKIMSDIESVMQAIALELNEE